MRSFNFIRDFALDNYIDLAYELNSLVRVTRHEYPVELQEPAFRPGAGHMPPYLAGREAEEREFRRLLGQEVILQNMILTGLRGLGKTVLLEKFKPIAIQEKWLWVGTDLSETVSVSEANLATRIITDLSVVTSGITLSTNQTSSAGFTTKPTSVIQPVNFAFLMRKFEDTPGVVIDKLKAVLEYVWALVRQTDRRGIVFAYDEAQNLADNAEKDQYPLSLMLDLFQSIQRKGIPFMLLLVGLPTLFPKLVEARTYSERMFRVVSLGQLTRKNLKMQSSNPHNPRIVQLRFRRHLWKQSPIFQEAIPISFNSFVEKCLMFGFNIR